MDQSDLGEDEEHVAIPMLSAMRVCVVAQEAVFIRRGERRNSNNRPLHQTFSGPFHIPVPNTVNVPLDGARPQQSKWPKEREICS